MLSDRNLYPGDANLEKVQGLVFPIVKVLRDESAGTYEYAYDQDLVIINGCENEYRIPITQFHSNASYLLCQIKSASSGTFAIPEIESFIRSFSCNSIKARSSKKSDIRVLIHDLRTGVNPELGFSIKSQLGGASTLLNAGKTTNFVFKIECSTITSADIALINSIESRSKIKDRIEAITKLGGVLKFLNTETTIFGNNLTLIDSALPALLASITLKFYSSYLNTLTDLVKAASKDNPLQYNISEGHPFYEYKMKRFLTDIALGMMPSKVWTGELDATGGYLIVKDDGELLCYHIYNRNQFEDYLLNNTKLETASSSRHEFGNVYSEKGNLYFKLNLQIRFLK